MADNETIEDIIAKKRRQADELESKIMAYKDNPSKDLTLENFALSLVAENRKEADNIEVAWKRERGDCAKLRERRLLMSCARWILCHDIYGHTAKELLAECKEVLNDDGQFLFKEDEQ